MDILFLILSVIVLSIVSYIMYEYVLYVRQFKYDKRNPHKRTCRKCGQEQNEFSDCLTCRPTWWEDVGEIKDPNCSCHEYSYYR
jgi:hypothetical protein